MRKIILVSLVFLFCSFQSFASSGSVDQSVIEATKTSNPTVQRPVEPNIPKGLLILNDYFAIDADHAYVINDTRNSWVTIPGVDRTSFAVIAGRFARDAGHIFQMGRILSADPVSFSVISSQHGYAQDAKHIFGPSGVIDDADPATFEMLTRSYAMDTGHVFFEGKTLLDANAGSFQVIDNGLYAIDDKSVFYAGEKLSDVSPVGFVVKGPRAFSADGRIFFEGKIEKGEIPTDEIPAGETDNDSSFKDALAAYMKYFTGEYGSFWSLVVLAWLAVFSFFFVFFAERNDEWTSFLQTFLKGLVSMVVGVIVYWLASLMTGTGVAIALGLLAAGLLFVSLFRTFGWIKSLLVTLLSLIAFLAVVVCGVFVARAIFGDMHTIMAYMMRPEVRMLGIMKIIGICLGTWLIVSQLGSSLFRSVGQALVATLVSLGLIAFLLWMGAMSTPVTVILFGLFYGILLWIMRFRTVSHVFAETVRIVRVTLILAVVIGIVVWIIL